MVISQTIPARTIDSENIFVFPKRVSLVKYVKRVYSLSKNATDF